MVGLYRSFLWILELARESSLYIFPPSSPPDASAPPPPLMCPMPHGACLCSYGFPSPQSVMTGVARMTAGPSSPPDASAPVCASPSARREPRPPSSPAPSFSSLLGNPVCIFLPSSSPPDASAPSPPLMCPMPPGAWLCSYGFPSPPSSQPMARRTGGRE